MKTDWPLVGRTGILRSLRESLLSPGGPGIVLSGPAGVGKTRLANEALQLAEAAGVATARVTATKASAGIPLGAMAPLLPPGRPSEPGSVDDRADLLRRCAQMLSERAVAGRLILLVDDAHLLDDASATLVHQLALTRAATLLATVRTGEPAPEPIVALWKDSLAERVELSGLPTEAISEVLTWVLQGPVDGAGVAALAAVCRGNVLFLRELVRGALEAGDLQRDDGIWHLVGDLRPTERLVELVEARMAGLGTEERQLLEAVSFAEPVGPAELGRLGDLDLAEQLERKGFLTSRVEGRRVLISLAHPLYGEVLRGRVPALRARSIARSLAEEVESIGARRSEDVLRVASWRLLGGGGDARLMTRAAEIARWRYDFQLAQRLVDAALEAGGGFEAKLLAAQLAALQGRSAEAADNLVVLAREAITEEQRGRVALSRLDNRVIYAGTIDEGLRIAEAAEQDLSGTKWADEIASRRAALLLAREGPRAAAEVAAPLLDRATGAALVWACMPGSFSLARTGRLSAALAAARKGRAAQLELPEPMDWYPWMHFFYESEALAHAGRLRDAQELAQCQYEIGVDNHSIEAQAMFSWQLSKAVADRGNVDDSILRASTALALYRKLDRPQFVEFCFIYLAMALAIGGRADEARAALRRHDQLGVQRGFFMGVDLDLAQGWTEVAAGSPPSARHIFADAADSGEKIGDLVGAAAALHALARIGHAKEVCRRLTDLAPEIEGEIAVARALHVCALSEGDGAELDRVSTIFDALGADLLAAESALDAAVAYRRAGEQREAVAAERRGQWLAARCAGARTPALQGTAARVRLTAAEWEAVQLAVAGNSNKQIAEMLVVSVRTIENRLQQVYGKLGIGGRASLPDALATVVPPESRQN